MAVTADKPAPYAPASAIIDLIDRYRNRGLPSMITPEVLARSGVSDSLIPRTMQALQTLDLIGENLAATQTLEGLRRAPETELKQRMADWVRGAYADVFSYVDPAKDDDTTIRDAFRSYNPVGQQSRMVTLFLGLCAAAGITAETPSQPRPHARTQKPATPAARTTQQKPPVKPQVKNPPVGDTPAAIAGLIASLPPQGEGWTKPDRDKFITTFTAVLDFCFPIVPMTAKDLGLE